MLKFSPANAKIKALENVEGIKPFLQGKRKVYSFDLLSGHTCPYAKDCHSKAVEQENGSLRIVDGKHTKYRCFSASQEVLYKPVFRLRKHNTDAILTLAATEGPQAVADLILKCLPKNAGVIRIHVGGDFKIRPYFEGWLLAAKARPDVLFYAYTKSLPFWIANRKELKRIPNFVLTASKGGYADSLIGKHRLRQAVVVKSVEEAENLGLPIDHDDSHAANPAMAKQSFALLVHGPQPAGSDWGKAVKSLKGVGSYRRQHA